MVLKRVIGSDEGPGLGAHLRMCTCERCLRRCIYMYFSAFNPKKLGPTRMIARRLFSIPLQCSSDWPDFTMWILTLRVSLSVAVDRPVGSCRAGQSIDLVTIIIHFLPCIASRTSQTGPTTTLLTTYFFSQYRREYPQEIFSTILSTTYFLSGLCVWRIYVYFLIICYDIWRIYHKISMYFLITCWMLQVLTVLDWWFILINLLIDKLELIRINWPEIKPSVCPKSCTIIIGEFKVKKRNSVEDTFTNNFQDSTLNEIAVVNFDSRFHPIINICW